MMFLDLPGKDIDTIYDSHWIEEMWERIGRYEEKRGLDDLDSRPGMVGTFRVRLGTLKYIP
jgi:hypothetical protein